LRCGLPASRTDGAKIGGMDRQTLRDWVIPFNDRGPDAGDAIDRWRIYPFHRAGWCLSLAFNSWRDLRGRPTYGENGLGLVPYNGAQQRLDT
jgi:hypothetical protein